jgi:hypothetical protein
MSRPGNVLEELARRVAENEAWWELNKHHYGDESDIETSVSALGDQPMRDVDTSSHYTLARRQETEEERRVRKDKERKHRERESRK